MASNPDYCIQRSDEEPDDGVTDDMIERALALDRYGDFILTDAVRPIVGHPDAVMPIEGWRRNIHTDQTLRKIPYLTIAASRQKLMDLFRELLDVFSETVDVFLETSRGCPHNTHRDLMRFGIDRPILESHLVTFEDLLLDDGYTGIAVVDPATPQEIQLTEHKTIFAYSERMMPLQRIVESFPIAHRSSLKLIENGRHLHMTDEDLHQRYQQLQEELGVEEA